LDASYRFNIPGTAEGNWQWRWRWESLESLDLTSLRQWTQIYGREPG
jgi:4-alpha-glucanotransferase